MTARDEDYLLDHEYDGIQEYDNPLPSWWVWIFWATIVFSVPYYLYYHVGIGPTIVDAHEQAAAAAIQRQNALFQNVTVDEQSLQKLLAGQPFQLADGSALEMDLGGMGQTFLQKCATCHGARAQGLTCPNLTDDYYKNGAKLMDIFRTIENGVPGTEMKSWRDDLGPAGLVAMAAYVGSLRGKNLPGRKAEGEKVILGEQ
ncbi:MAG: cbb3-type cytochrome c oxidase N-terminal domain-containing protein [Planctomycetota bacterium]